MMPISYERRASYSWMGERRMPRGLEVANRGLEAPPESLAAHLLKVAVDGVALGDREGRERILHRVQLEVAALGDLHGAGKQGGVVREEARHLVGALDEELVGVELEAILVVNLGAGLDAEHHVVGVRVFAAQVMGIVGGDEGDVEVFFQAEEIVVDLAFGFEALVLDFEIEVAAAEDVLVLKRDALGFLIGRLRVVLVFLIQEKFAKLAGEAAGRADEALGVAGEEALGDARLAIEAVQRGLGGDANQVLIALFVFGEDEEVVVLVFGVGRNLGAMVLALRHVELAAENGADAALLGGVEEVDRAEDVAVVGHGHGLLAQGGDAVHELGEVACAVEEGVLGVQMEVGEFGHG